MPSQPGVVQQAVGTTLLADVAAQRLRPHERHEAQDAEQVRLARAVGADEYVDGPEVDGRILDGPEALGADLGEQRPGRGHGSLSFTLIVPVPHHRTSAARAKSRSKRASSSGLNESAVNVYRSV